MLRQYVIYIVLSLLPAGPVLAADFDWHSKDNRELLDQAMSKVAAQCSNFGFVTASRSPDVVMEKRIYGGLLLKSATEADADVDRWVGYFLAMTKLGDKERIEFFAKNASDALAAAQIDPSYYEQARVKYVEAVTEPLRQFFFVCDAMESDEFLQKNYIQGEGSLKSYQEKAIIQFDKSLDELNNLP